MACASVEAVYTCREWLSELSERACERGVSEDVALYCERESLRRFAPAASLPADELMRRRLSAYYAAVLRGRIKRSRGASLARARRKMVLMTLAEDLAGVGASRERIVSELRDAYGATADSGEIELIAEAVAQPLAS